MVKSTLLSPSTRRAALSLVLACAMATGLSLYLASRRAAVTTARLHSAERELEALTDGPADTLGRAAIAWGYAERMRLGLESPFRLIEAASRDPRLSRDEQRTVSWALLAALTRGESHQVDAASLDRLVRGKDVAGDQHLALIESEIARAGDPRSAELALRLAYTLAAAERLVDPSAPQIIANASALIADRELGRRESQQLLRGEKPDDAIAAIVRSRKRNAFYVERPVLMEPPRQLESDAIRRAGEILAVVRAMAPRSSDVDSADVVGGATTFQPALLASSLRVEPAAELTMAVRRWLPALNAQLPAVAADRFGRVRNTEMLSAAMAGQWSRDDRRNIGRLHLAAAVGMRARAQEPLWFTGDPVPSLEQLGVSRVSFDDDVPRSWRPSYLASLDAALENLRLVFPQLDLTGVTVRFRVTSPADSALAMHEPQTRTLHLPVATAAGTLTHEIAHDLDRQVSLLLGRQGYWSDAANRGGRADAKLRGAASRVAASLRAMTDETAAGRRDREAHDRPAEIFATRVDWFVSQSLARQGRSSGFLSAVQDELITGHVLHPERLRGAARSRSLLTALEGMTTVAPAARVEAEPTVYAMVQHVLRSPMERRGPRQQEGWMTPSLSGFSCGMHTEGHAGLLVLAAESRARGVVRASAESIPAERRPNWARAALGEAPWASAALTERVEAVAGQLLAQLANPGLMQGGVGSRVDALIGSARCRE
jgi:hypothetical protein